ncbi:Meteorin-like protein [Sarcoptes scabiei]|uniref:Meteorin-like protein n=1 Tax=Sarcoptes scabiei TaxID=52283 RepID=A0A834R625_SARSC|nr:Meteorin-like protein [Sarcoptes scabiei]
MVIKISNLIRSPSIRPNYVINPFSLLFSVAIFYILINELNCYDVYQTTSYVSDNCDWFGSKTSSIDVDRTVMPIYLRCSRGSIKWFYPTGGLRVVLKFGTDEKDFRGCIRVSKNSSQKARIYVEGKRELFQIWSADDNKHPDLFRCFVSNNHFIALFIESDLNSSNYQHRNDAVIFQYDLEQQNTNSLSLKPDCSSHCSDQELLNSFCSNDFALLGHITYYQTRPEIELTEFYIKPHHIYRLPLNDSIMSDLELIDHHPIDATYTDEEINIQNVSISSITLNRQAECDFNEKIATQQKQLFMGRFILGKLFVSCAVRLEHWNRLKADAINAGMNQCQML